MFEPWGKWKGLAAPYRLVWHSVDAAAAAYVLWESHVPVGVRAWLAAQWRVSEGHARWVVALLAGLHDVGKCEACFQGQRGGGEPHALVSYLSVPSVLCDPAAVGLFVESVAHRVGEVLGGHHGVFPAVDPDRVGRPERVKKLGGELWQGRRRELVEVVRRVLGDPALPPVFPAGCAAVVTGLVIVADWLVSEVGWLEDVQGRAPREWGARWTHTVESVRKRVSELGLRVPELRASASVRDLVGAEPRPLQRSLEEEFRPERAGLLVVTASTGVGKTEAVAAAARGLGVVSGRPGVVWCLPTRATTNAMWVRWTGFERVMSVRPGAVTLAHSMASFHGEYQQYLTEDAGLVWLNDPHKPMLAGLSVVTVDQVLTAVLASKFNVVRLWALSGKVLVIDECHSLEPYMLALLGRLLSWCGFLRVPVVLLSATLPASVTRELTKAYLSGVEPGWSGEVAVPEYPGWVCTDVDGRVQRPSPEAAISIRGDGQRVARLERARYGRGQRGNVIANYARRAVAEGGCVAVVCATVPIAQATYRRLVSLMPENTVTLLHARVPERRRVRVEDEVVAAFGKDSTSQTRSSRIVVTTSLLEQSLDVDFDLVISDLAPIAYLVQRLGRCHRHDRDEPRPEWLRVPTLVVLDPKGPVPRHLSALYPEYELLATRTVLAEHGPVLRVPEDVDALVQRVHSHELPPLDPKHAKQWAERHAKTKIHKGLSRFEVVPVPDMVRDLSAMTRRAEDGTALSTRLGVDSARVIPYTEDQYGKRWLDEGIPMPGTLLNDESISLLVNYSIPCPMNWVRGFEQVPDGWTHPVLRRARLMPKTGRAGLRVDDELGLVQGSLDDGER
jgi:CRISPR-associated endonuclease/helicase Cas3